MQCGREAEPRGGAGEPRTYYENLGHGTTATMLGQAEHGWIELPPQKRFAKDDHWTLRKLG